VSALASGASGQGSPQAIEPELELIAGSPTVLYERAKGEGIWLDLGLHLAATEAPFELRLHRDDYLDPIDVVQVLEGPGGVSQDRSLPTDVMSRWDGLDDFLHATITDANGEVATEITTDFCPNSYDMQRVNDEGPQTPTYPSSCGAGLFTRGMVWGINEGWAARVFDFSQQPIRLRAGEYQVTVEISPRYVDMFSIDPAASSAEVVLTVKTVKRETYPPYGKAQAHVAEKPYNVPIIEQPDPATLPDLTALPAWNMQVTHGKTKARLNFSATIAVEGASSMVVEGFRRPGEAVMDAFQYFYSGGEVVGRASVGAMEFDDRDGHDHWHFKQFARYTLLDADQNEIMLSRKESFCLAPTDVIDLLIEGAEWRVENTDLSTACGSRDSLWVREILPLGWADTYTQSLPGQSFNITDLPNGKYYVAVEANPEGNLFEQTSDNNVELREIFLKGKGLDRRVVVPPWNGIDTEGEIEGEEGGEVAHNH
jgi:hypothetical protein